MTLAVPVLTCAEAGAFEKKLLVDEAAVAGAIARAGRGLAEAVERDFLWWREWPEKPKLLILAGKGHNAADALTAAAWLGAWHDLLEVEVVWVFGEEGRKPQVRAAAEALQASLGERARFSAWEAFLESPAARGRYDVTLDGIVGMQFSPPWRGAGEAVVDWSRDQAKRLGLRVAIDLPSGMADKSAEAIWKADVTYALGIAKAPLLEPGAARVTGRVRFLDLGFFGAGKEAEGGDRIGLPALLRSIGRLRAAGSDKRTFGHVGVLGGSVRYPGAVLMAASAAARGGAGLVTALVPSMIAASLAASAPEVMWRPLPATGEGTLKGEGMREISALSGARTVYLAGPGLLPDRGNLFLLGRLVREVHSPLVLDAGALDPEVLPFLTGRPREAGPVVITPHQGEFNRLNRDVGGDYAREALIAFARKHRVTVVLKGTITRVCDGERVIHLPVGNPVLARGGSGDMLAGMLAARLALHPKEPTRAAVEAVTWHGAAADALARARGETGVRATELLDYLAPALREAWPR